MCSALQLQECYCHGNAESLSDLTDEPHNVQARPVADKSPWLLAEVQPIPGFLSRCHKSCQGPMCVRDTVASVHTEACSGCLLPVSASVC